MGQEEESAKSADGATSEEKRPGDQPLFSPGRTLPEHERLARVGRGVHATVYKVRLPSGDIRALRLPNLHTAASVSPPGMDGSRGGFPEGMECWASVSDLHGVVSIHEMGLEPRPWALLEYCVDSLKTRGDELTSREVAAMLVALSETVETVHQRGVAHLDLKQSNVLLSAAGQPRLGDWGEAKRLEEDATLKQLQDIRALGLLAYELLTGLEPYDRSARADIATFFEPRSIMPPSEVDSTLPASIDAPILDTFARPERATTESLDRLARTLSEAFELG